MPYTTSEELPDSVRRVLSIHAQHIYKDAFNSAYDEYQDLKSRSDDADREEVARKVAWAAVKKKYVKGEDDKWHPIDR